MKKMIIKVLTKKGEEAIKQNQKESLKIRWDQRLFFKTAGYTQSMPDKKTLVIEITNKRLQNVMMDKHFKLQAEDMMRDNGAEKKDYKIEVI